MDRLLHHAILGKINQGDIFQESRIQGGEGFPLATSVSRQRFLNGRGRAVQEFHQPLYPNAGGKVTQGRVLLGKTCVQKHQAGGLRVVAGEGPQVGRGQLGVVVTGRNKGPLCQGDQAGEAPFLVMSGRESKFPKTSDRGLAFCR